MSQLQTTRNFGLTNRYEFKTYVNSHLKLGLIKRKWQQNIFYGRNAETEETKAYV